MGTLLGPVYEKVERTIQRSSFLKDMIRFNLTGAWTDNELIHWFDLNGWILEIVENSTGLVPAELAQVAKQRESHACQILLLGHVRAALATAQQTYLRE